jgi:hypothetical protein
LTIKLTVAILLLLAIAACSPPPKATAKTPAPPKIEAAKPRKIVPGPNDRMTHRCTVVKQNANSVDCVCLHISEKIDSVTGAHSTECREEKPSAKH